MHPRGSSRSLLHAEKSYDMGPPALLLIRKEVVVRIFIAIKKSIAFAEFEPANFGSSGKHINHYTTKATSL
jgi:hypothetical protein